MQGFLETPLFSCLRKHGVCRFQAPLLNELSTPQVAVNYFHTLCSFLDLKLCLALPGIFATTLPPPSFYMWCLVCENLNTNRLLATCVHITLWLEDPALSAGDRGSAFFFFTLTALNAFLCIVYMLLYYIYGVETSLHFNSLVVNSGSSHLELRSSITCLPGIVLTHLMSESQSILKMIVTVIQVIKHYSYTYTGIYTCIIYLCRYAWVDQRHRQVLYQRYIRAGLRYIRSG